MAKALTIAKAWRIAKRTPLRAIDDWKADIFNGGNAVGFALAIFSSWLGLQTAAIPQVIDEANGWLNAIQAFVYVSLAWAVFCLVRAPFRIASEDVEQGRWYGNTYDYGEPLLIATIRCRKDQPHQSYDFCVESAESHAFVYVTAEFDRPVPNVVAQLGGDVFTKNPTPEVSHSEFRLRDGKMGSLMLHGDLHFEFNARVYLHQFEVNYGQHDKPPI